MIEPVEIQHTLDHRFVKKAPGQGRGCGTCGLAKTHIQHMGTPPSLNVHGSGANPFVYQAIKQAWQARIRYLLTRELAGNTEDRHWTRVLVEGQMCFPDHHRRDQGNYRFVIEKATGDALKEGGWLQDDSWDQYEFGGLAYCYEKGQSWTRLAFFPTR